MTQALLNNLNNIIENASSKVKAETSDVNDFESLLGGIQASEPTSLNAEDKDDSSQANITNRQDLGSIFIQEFNEAILEASVEETADLSLMEDSPENIDQDSAPADISTITNNEEITTITNEDSTMRKELTPENPMTMVLLNQTQNENQIFKKIGNDSLNESENNIITMKKTEDAEQIINFDKKHLEFLSSIKDSKANSLKEINDIAKKEIIEDLNIESISSESTEENPSGNLMQNQSPQEQVVKAMIQGNVKFEEINIKTASQNVPKPSEVDSSKLMDQITKQLQSMHNSKVNIVLNPESLGKIALQIVNTKDGLSAEFTVTNQDVRDMLYKGLNSLKESLLAQGVSVDNVTVKLSESSLENNDFKENWTEQEGSKGGNKGQNQKQQKQDEKQFEQTMFEINNKK